ncbi:MAG TPA: rhomboid family intramembrane serine protease [Chitinophagaceae bacterium]|nr:rhomboid family intramembrane serine protease [Chitinophagaceae bacterium]
MELSFTLIIVIATTLVSIGGLSNYKIMDDLIFYPPAIQRRQYYRLITHGFLHADYFHLAFNMVALWSFGEAVEQGLFSNPCVFGENGRYFFLLLYFLALIFASLPDYFRHRNNYHFRSLGASGAVSAVIFAAIVLLPQMPIRFLFIPIDIPGFIFGAIYLLASAYLDKRGGGNINHMAHIFGALFGVIFVYVLVSLVGQLDVIDNFMKQVRSLRQFLPFEC